MGQDQGREPINEENHERRGTGEAFGACEGTLEEGKGSRKDSSITSG